MQVDYERTAMRKYREQKESKKYSRKKQRASSSHSSQPLQHRHQSSLPSDDTLTMRLNQDSVVTANHLAVVSDAQ